MPQYTTRWCFVKLNVASTFLPQLPPSVIMEYNDIEQNNLNVTILSGSVYLNLCEGHFLPYTTLTGVKKTS